MPPAANKGVPLSEEMKAALAKAKFAAGNALARRQWQGGRCQDAGHGGAEHRPSRPISPMSPPKSCCRCSRRATSRSCGVLVARSRRQPTNTGDSLNNVTPGNQRPDVACRHQKCRQQSGAMRKALDDLGLAATTNIMNRGRSRFFDDFQGEQDQPVGEG